MNKLIRCVISFVLPFFCLLVSVSYAFEFEPNVQVPSYKGSDYRVSLDMSTNINSSYTFSEVYSIAQTYWTDQSNESTFLDMKNSIVSSGYTIWFGKGDSSQFLCYVWKDTECDVGAKTGVITPYVTCKSGDYLYFYDLCNACYFEKFYGECLSMARVYRTEAYLDYKFGPGKIKLLVDKTWDGVSYQTPSVVGDTEPIEPETPTMPSNAEIAQAVQAFYNSDYYKNNKDFSDFMVLYNYETKYFDFVGHNFGIDLGQVIVPPDYEYEGYSYKQDWWKFFLRNISAEIASNLWNKYYWLYSTNDFGENIEYDGKGSIKALVNVHFSTSSIIVYSTTDYPVVKIETDENGVLTPVEGTVPGNQYTYDENLDPTTNEYNPLENFVPSNPAQSILGDVDFDAINKTFEENKDILNIESASWLFAANNQLTNYFIGFLSLLIVFLIISRILGG